MSLRVIFCLPIFQLLGAAICLGAIQLNEKQAMIETETFQARCPDSPTTPDTTGVVTFVHGQVIDQEGQQIEAGFTLRSAQQLSAQADGFLSIRLATGRVLNIHPDTETSIACELGLQSGNFQIQQPYLVGAIRG